MRSVLVRSFPSLKSQDLVSKPATQVIINSAMSIEMANFKTQDKHFNSAKHFSTQNQISLTSMDLQHALWVQDVQKCFVCCTVVLWSREYHMT